MKVIDRVVRFFRAAWQCRKGYVRCVRRSLSDDSDRSPVDDERLWQRWRAKMEQVLEQVRYLVIDNDIFRKSMEALNCTDRPSKSRIIYDRGSGTGPFRSCNPAGVAPAHRASLR